VPRVVGYAEGFPSPQGEAAVPSPDFFLVFVSKPVCTVAHFLKVYSDWCCDGKKAQIRLTVLKRRQIMK